MSELGCLSKHPVPCLHFVPNSLHRWKCFDQGIVYNNSLRKYNDILLKNKGKNEHRPATFLFLIEKHKVTSPSSFCRHWSYAYRFKNSVLVALQNDRWSTVKDDSRSRVTGDRTEATPLVTSPSLLFLRYCPSVLRSESINMVPWWYARCWISLNADPER